MLDKVKIRDEKLKWQLANTITPILFFIVMGIIVSVYRKKKYS
jgi:ABC-2 type transport system permease protein